MPRLQPLPYRFTPQVHSPSFSNECTAMMMTIYVCELPKSKPLLVLVILNEGKAVVCACVVSSSREKSCILVVQTYGPHP